MKPSDLKHVIQEGLDIDPFFSKYVVYLVVDKEGVGGVLCFDHKENTWDIRNSWGVCHSETELSEIIKKIKSWEYTQMEEKKS